MLTCNKNCAPQGNRYQIGHGLKSTAEDRNGGSGHIFAVVSREPHDQAGHLCGLHPPREIGPGMSLRFAGVCHGAGPKHVGGDE
jgi:hypothetical protein